VTRPKLLLADDSVTIRKVVELTFADEGVDVTTVADGADAMSRFVEIQPDIVLVDVGLPGTNGYHICEMIKGDETTAHIPVLLLVGSFEPFDQDAAEKSGADGFLTKPFHSIRDLVNRVHELLGTQQQHGIDDVVDFETARVTETENADIDELYERSFAETMPIENYETVPSFGTEDAFPDHLADQKPTSDEADEGAERVDTVDDSGAMDTIAVSSEDTLDASHHSVDEWLDDDMIETIRSSEPEEVQHAQEAAVEAVAHYQDAPAAAVDTGSTKEFDWSPEAVVTAEEETENSVAAGAASEPEPLIEPDGENRVSDETRENTTDDAPVDVEEDHENTTPASDDSEIRAAQSPATFADLSPEMIDLIVHRVMERLSDRAVREVAQEAVPRIAERLMREALEEDRNR
jgi:CheY-like chemotaxis protein